jgi:hypothetical protein
MPSLLIIEKNSEVTMSGGIIGIQAKRYGELIGCRSEASLACQRLPDVHIGCGIVRAKIASFIELRDRLLWVTFLLEDNAQKKVRHEIFVICR